MAFNKIKSVIICIFFYFSVFSPGIFYSQTEHTPDTKTLRTSARTPETVLHIFQTYTHPRRDTSSISASVTGFKIHICVSVLSENTIYGGTFSSDAISRRSARSASKSVSSFSVNSAARLEASRPGGSFAASSYLFLPPLASSSRLAPVLPGKQHLFPSI